MLFALYQGAAFSRADPAPPHGGSVGLKPHEPARDFSRNQVRGEAALRPPRCHPERQISVVILSESRHAGTSRRTCICFSDDRSRIATCICFSLCIRARLSAAPTPSHHTEEAWGLSPTKPPTHFSRNQVRGKAAPRSALSSRRERQEIAQGASPGNRPAPSAMQSPRRSRAQIAAIELQQPQRYSVRIAFN